MKIIIILLIGMVSQLAAAPYVEYKNEVVFKYDNYVKNLNHFRVGYQFILQQLFLLLIYLRHTSVK